MRKLYPRLEPYRSGLLRVSDLHELYYEECGNPRGKPVIFLHGGPGGGLSPDHRRYFDPKRWRVILFDQRGCGKSRPHAELRENTTWELVADIERLRRHCGIEKWTVFGGSWGSTLALAYAETHARQCRALILRGIFLLQRWELDWFYKAEGTARLFPDLWEPYEALIPARERGDMIKAYYKRLTSPSRAVRLRAAKAWSLWEGATIKLLPDAAVRRHFSAPRVASALARIECHYFVNRGFMRRDGQLLSDAKKLRGIPGVIVQGRYDVICPPAAAWSLHRAWPGSKLVIVPDAGHAMSEPGIRSALLDATDRFGAR